MRTLTFSNGYTLNITRTKGIFGIKYFFDIFRNGKLVCDDKTALFNLREIFSMARTAQHLRKTL